MVEDIYLGEFYEGSEYTHNMGRSPRPTHCHPTRGLRSSLPPLALARHPGY